MKNFLIFLTLFLFTSNAVAQVPYTPFEFDSNVWQTSYYGNFFVKAEYETLVVGDTIIDNKTFFKLHRYGMEYYYDDPNQFEIVDSMEVDRFVGLIRENTQKQVEFINPGSNTINIIFDFNITLGDTIPVFDFGAGSYINAKVEATEVVEICGVLRNKYTIWFYEYGSLPSYIIDGIGSSAGILPVYEYFEQGSFLNCYSDNNCNCFENVVNTEVVDTEEMQIEIFPNPVTANEFTILSERDLSFEIEIYNAVGERMLLNKREDSTHLINTSNWPSGCYYLKIKKDGYQKMEKLIVH